MMEVTSDPEKRSTSAY